MTRAALLGLAVLALCGCGREPAAPPAAAPRTGGPPAPAFELVDPNGARHALSSFRGRPAIVTFWATWCGPCQQELPTLVALQRRLGARIVAISVDRDVAAVRAYLARTPLPFTVLLDPDGAVERTYGVTTIPAAFVLDAEGRVIERVDGATDWNDRAMREWLDPLFGAHGGA